LFEARSRHDGTHRPHAPKLQSRYYWRPECLTKFRSVEIYYV
jgi:hypothetical protein